MGRVIHGECRICGTHTRLTYEHVPPRCAFNDEPIKSYKLSEWWKLQAGKPARHANEQRGAGDHLLCDRCNNHVCGTWYVPELCTWVRAVAVANIKALRDERVPEHVSELEPYFRAGLDELARRHRSVKEVRGMGYLYGLELVADRDAGREFTPSEKAEVCGRVLPTAMHRAGLSTRADDRGPAILMLAPPLVADRSVLDDLFTMVDSTLSELDRWLATTLEVAAASR
jgi:Aminotransferase class-III